VFVKSSELRVASYSLDAIKELKIVSLTGERSLKRMASPYTTVIASHAHSSKHNFNFWNHLFMSKIDIL